MDRRPDKSVLPGRFSESDSSEKNLPPFKKPAAQASSSKGCKNPKGLPKSTAGDDDDREATTDTEIDDAPIDENCPLGGAEHDDDNEDGDSGLAGMSKALKASREKALKRPSSKVTKASGGMKKPASRKQSLGAPEERAQSFP